MAHRTPTSGAKQVGDDKVATLLSTTIEIPRNGYLYTYTSNETKNIDVYFDNLQLSHTRSPLLEENNYYAFGGDIKALCSKAMKGLAYINNNAKFNSGTEFNDDLDIALYETPFRNYNAQIGRFQGIDKLSELTPSLTPMQFGGNNPISFNDPSGLACADAPMIGGPLEDATVYGTIGGGGSAAWSRSSYLVFLEIMNSYYGSIAESNGGSGSDERPDGWVPDGDSYKYVNDKTKGVKEKVFLDRNGKTMHGKENGELVELVQQLEDVVVGGTRHKDGWVEPAGITNGSIGTLAGIVENFSGRLTIGSNYKFYPGGFRGNQYVYTVQAAKIGKIAGYATFGLGTIIDGVGVINYYRYGSNDPNAVHPVKAGVNFTIGMQGLYGGPPGWILGTVYFVGDVAIPGGWPAALEAGYQNTKNNRELLGPNWSPRPGGGLL